MAYNLQSWQNTFGNNPVNRNIFTSQALNQNMFTPQALKYANMAKNFGGTALRYSGIMNPMGAAATAAWAAPKAIDYLTKRDPNATQSSLFGIDLTKNANEGAALPGSTLNDWGSTMGDVPDGGVVPPIKNINRPLQDTYQRSPHRGFEEMQFDETVQAPEKKGFSFDPRNWGVMGLMKKMVEPNTPEENFGRGYFNMDSSGRTYGNQAHDVFAGKNVVSAYGKGMGAAAQKRIDTIENTLRNKYNLGDEEIEDVYAGTYKGPVTSQLIQRLRNFKNQHNQYNQDFGGATTGGATTTENVVTNVTSPNVGGDGASRDQGGGYSTRGGFTGTRGQEPGTRGGATSGSGRGHHSWRAEGGRIGYRTAGPVFGHDEPSEPVLDFMQDQGIPISEQVEGEGGVLEQLIAKYIEAGFPPDQAEEMAMEEFQQMAMGSEQGIASLV